MKCPNCINETDFREIKNNGQNFKGSAYTRSKRVMCLKCGYKFSKIIEKRYM